MGTSASWHWGPLSALDYAWLGKRDSDRRTINIVGLLLAGIVAFIVLRTLGEMAVHEPVAGSFAAYANTYVGPLAGYMVGWGYWTYWIVVGIAEVTAVGIYMTIWFPETPQWIWVILYP